MDTIGQVHRIAFNLFGLHGTIAPKMLYMTWIVITILILLGFFGGRKLKDVPHGLQNFWEMIIGFFDEIVVSTLDESGRKFTPMITTLFLFICISNLLGMVPGLAEPTKYLSTDLGLGLMIFVIVHYSAIKAKGFIGYLQSYCEPVFIFAPLNVIGELAKVVSHSFRLFGNILGGSIIIVILSYLTKYLGLPIFLQLFFGMFSGLIQAFVFTMLAVTYIAVATK
ncbi:MAG: F0F1 ATP synthase subunit A [Candidatus Margulisiibacteriota bacterium]